MTLQCHLLENSRIKISVKGCHTPYPKLLTTTIYDLAHLKCAKLDYREIPLRVFGHQLDQTSVSMGTFGRYLPKAARIFRTLSLQFGNATLLSVLGHGEVGTGKFTLSGDGELGASSANNRIRR